MMKEICEYFSRGYFITGHTLTSRGCYDIVMSNDSGAIQIIGVRGAKVVRMLYELNHEFMSDFDENDL